MPLRNDPNKTNFASFLGVDKIIGTYEGSFVLNSPPPGGDTVVTEVINTNIPESTFFQGIYSLDNGATWNGFGTRKNHVESSNPAVNPQGESYVWGKSESGTITIVGENSALLSAIQLFNFTVMYKVVLIAKPDQGKIIPQPIGGDTFFDSRWNYQKIAVDDITPLNGTNVTVSVAHNLGYIPVVRVFREASGVLTTNYVFSSHVSIDDTTVSTYLPGSVTGKLYTRIYYEQ